MRRRPEHAAGRARDVAHGGRRLGLEPRQGGRRRRRPGFDRPAACGREEVGARRSCASRPPRGPSSSRCARGSRAPRRSRRRRLKSWNCFLERFEEFCDVCEARRDVAARRDRLPRGIAWSHFNKPKGERASCASSRRALSRMGRAGRRGDGRAHLAAMSHRGDRARSVAAAIADGATSGPIVLSRDDLGARAAKRARATPVCRPSSPFVEVDAARRITPRTRSRTTSWRASSPRRGRSDRRAGSRGALLRPCARRGPDRRRDERATQAGAGEARPGAGAVAGSEGRRREAARTAAVPDPGRRGDRVDVDRGDALRRAEGDRQAESTSCSGRPTWRAVKRSRLPRSDVEDVEAQ